MNKKRNTYFLHKVIVEEITSRISKKEDFEELKKIHERFFATKKELGKELSILHEFFTSNVATHEEAFRFLIEMKNQYKSLSKDRIFKEQTSLIKAINKVSKEIFNNHLVEYRKICNLNNFLNGNLKVSEKIKIQNSLHESLMSKKTENNKKIEKIERIANKKLHERFFQKYENINEELKWVLKKLLVSESRSEMATLHQEIYEKCSKKLEILKENSSEEAKAVLEEAKRKLEDCRKFSDENLQSVISLYERALES